MGVNQFTIFTDQEFRTRFLSDIAPAHPQTQMKEESYQGPNIEIDWTTKGAVSGVKNQGQCGSCWAFSATGVSESWALLEKKSVSLSEQQLVDCSASYGNHGCNGGWPSSALKYVKDHGLSSESQYPYKAKTETCQKQGGDFKITTISSVAGCAGLESGIASRPLSVTVDAANWSHYSSGVFNNCGHSIDHAVLLVGVVGGAWKIKNSWGTSWGEHGYIRLAGGNTCGVCANGGVYPH
jgi:C1A family cysteine protease